VSGMSPIPGVRVSVLPVRIQVRALQALVESGRDSRTAATEATGRSVRDS
jgi:hypothetical protein